MDLELILKVLTFLTVAITAGFTIRRFGLHRESATFLRVLVEPKEVVRIGDLVLTTITIKLDNLGQTRIDARTKPRAKGLLYDDGWDRCQHAGTLKVRPISAAKEPLVVDWYSLPTTKMATTTTSDLEQINYLDEYQDPDAAFAETHFWLEPKESYDLRVMVWLPVGTYAAKAVFLGKDVSHKNEEYWSNEVAFTVGGESP